MDDSSSSGDDENFDKLCQEIDNLISTFRSAQAMPRVTEASSSASGASGSGSKVIDYFIGMGFPEKRVAEAILANGEENTDSILETLLTLSAIEEYPETQPNGEAQPTVDESFLDGFSDTDSDENELAKMGYSKEESSIALERCGSQASMPTAFEAPKVKRKIYHRHSKQKKKLKIDDEIVRLPNPMIPSGLPTVSASGRTLPEVAMGPPYFYYQNVAMPPKGFWQNISDCLYQVKPEFIDLEDFCPAVGNRGYIHNLPIQNRFHLLPKPPLTIHEALPMTKKSWPSWDTRTKLNCLKYVTVRAKLTDKILKAVAPYEGEPPDSVKEFVLEKCRTYNLVWVGNSRVAPLEADEIEKILGFPKYHTRGGGANETDRCKLLGNSLQIDAVAHHLSVLKGLFPEGINLLSLFSGIGGAEIALDRLGIKLKNVVTVEKSKVNRVLVRCWWEETHQARNLIEFEDVEELKEDKLEQLIKSFGGFDLIIVGSSGLEGEDSLRFFHYSRIFDSVKRIMKRN